MISVYVVLEGYRCKYYYNSLEKLYRDFVKLSQFEVLIVKRIFSDIIIHR